MKSFISDAHLASRRNDVIQDHLAHFLWISTHSMEVLKFRPFRIDLSDTKGKRYVWTTDIFGTTLVTRYYKLFKALSQRRHWLAYVVSLC